MTRTRRNLLASGTAFFGVAAAALWRGMRPSQAAAPDQPAFELSLADEEWRRRLTSAQYTVLRKQGTERPFTSPLNAEHRSGRFACAGCALALFDAKAKFDSGTGWPSFYEALPGAVVDRSDWSFGMRRTETLCRRCGGHLGHVFDDGPRPTGLRYCMNGVALTFTPDAA